LKQKPSKIYWPPLVGFAEKRSMIQKMRCGCMYREAPTLRVCRKYTCTHGPANGGGEEDFGESEGVRG